MTKEERLAAERLRIEDMHNEEHALAERAAFIFGIDEAGRGPLCGPVAAGCCIFEADTRILYLNDSKKLSEKKREQLYSEITEKALAYGIGMASPQRIDEINILNATYEAMKDAFENCLSMLESRLTDWSLKQKAADGSQDGSLKQKTADGFLNGMNADGSSFITDAAGEDHIQPDNRQKFMPDVDNTIILVDGNKTVPGIYYKQSAIVKGDARCPSISAASILAKVTRDRIMEEYARQHPEYGFEKHKGYGTREHIEAIKKYGVTDIYRKSFLRNILK